MPSSRACPPHSRFPCFLGATKTSRKVVIMPISWVDKLRSATPTPRQLHKDYVVISKWNWKSPVSTPCPLSWVPELFAWHRGVTFLYPNLVLFRSGVTSLLPSPTASPSLAFIGHLLLARLSEKRFANINSKCSQFLYYPHFKDGETEAQRRDMT